MASSWTGMRSVVIPPCHHLEEGGSPKPTTERRPGTRSVSDPSTSMRPVVIWTAAVITAVGCGKADRILRPDAAPNSRVVGPSNSVASWAPTSAAASAQSRAGGQRR